MSQQNHYETLGLTPEADGPSVHRAYWDRARRYQALAPSDPRAHGMLDELNEAYAVLGTPSLREEYDATLRSGPAAPEPRERPASRLRALLRPRPATPRPEPPRVPATPAATAAPLAAAIVRPSSRGTTAEELRASTASMLGRWRKVAPATPLAAKPDTTLVDIFQSERDVAEAEEPLNAVLDVLRGSREPVEMA